MNKPVFDTAKEIAREAFSACKSVSIKEQESSLEVILRCLEISDKNSEVARKIIEDPDRTPEEKASAYEMLREERIDRKEIRSEHRDYGKAIVGTIIGFSLAGGWVLLTVVNPELGQRCLQAAGKMLPAKAAR